jgi:phospholipid transport system substrate-binding protein
MELTVERMHQSWSLGSRLVLVMLSCIVLVSPVQAADVTPPDKLIVSLFEEINQRLNKEQDKIAADRSYLITIGDEVLAPYVSFETMAKQILGKNWRKITPDQRVRYSSAFRQRVSMSVITQYDPAKHYTLEVTGSRQNDKGDRSAVSSVVTETKTGQKYNIAYKLFVDRATGHWQVYDIVVEGVSVLQSFKTASAEDFKNNGIEYMIAQLLDSDSKAESKSKSESASSN